MSNNNLLFVSGNEDFLEMYGRIILPKISGVNQVICCVNITETFQAMDNHEIKLLFSDRKIGGDPSGWGTEIIKQAKLLNPGIKTILMSGTPKEKASLIDVPVDIYLHKPFKKQELVRAVESLLR